MTSLCFKSSYCLKLYYSLPRENTIYRLNPRFSRLQDQELRGYRYIVLIVEDDRVNLNYILVSWCIHSYRYDLSIHHMVCVS